MNTEKKAKKSTLLPYLLAVMLLAILFVGYVNIYEPEGILQCRDQILVSLGGMDVPEVPEEDEGYQDYTPNVPKASEAKRKADAEACEKITQRGFLVTKHEGLGSSVAISDITLDDDLAGQVGKLVYLNSVNLQNVKMTPAQAKTMFKNLTRVASLRLTNCTVTPEMMPLFARMPRLASFSLTETQVTGEYLKPILKNPGLRILNLSSTSLGDDDMDVVARFGQLDHLLLENTKITDAGLKKLEAIPRVRRLTIKAGNGALSAEALRSLQEKVPELSTLD